MFNEAIIMIALSYTSGGPGRSGAVMYRNLKMIKASDVHLIYEVGFMAGNNTTWGFLRSAVYRKVVTSIVIVIAFLS